MASSNNVDLEKINQRVYFMLKQQNYVILIFAKASKWAIANIIT